MKMAKKGRRCFLRTQKDDTENLLTDSPKMMARTKHMMFQNKQQMAKERATMEAKLRNSVILDVGGDRFLALKCTLDKYPNARLGN